MWPQLLPLFGLVIPSECKETLPRSIPGDVSKPSLTVAAGLFVFTLYLIRGVIYRLFLSPVSKFPGPRLAGLTYLYEFYWDVIVGPEYTFKISRLHEEYGPIVRINPAELHISTPDYYDKIYAGSGRKRDKWDWITKGFGVDESLVGTVPHDHHRIRRASLAPFFSKASVRALQPLIEKELTQMMKRFQGFQKFNEPVNLTIAFAAFTNDVVMQYAFGRSDHRLQAPDFDPSFQNALVAGGKAGHVLKHFPWLMKSLRSLPDSLLLKLSPTMGSYAKLQTDIKRQVSDIQQDHSNPAFDKSRRTIFHEILDSNLSPHDKSTDRLWQEGEVIVAAGTITTASALSVAAYFLLAEPTLLKTLKAELQKAIPSPSEPMSLVALEQLPFLTGVVQEGTRLSHAVDHRLQRICPDETLVFHDGKKEWSIPPGTPISMTNNLVNHDESIFPSPHTFRPERWIENPLLSRYQVSFGKGGRACLGINLAYAELYLALAAIFRLYGSTEVQGEDDVGVLELHETTRRDVVFDMVNPMAEGDSKGVRIIVREKTNKSG